MNDMLVAKVWMAGVLAMMALFGVVALLGYYRARRNGTLTVISGDRDT